MDLNTEHNVTIFYLKFLKAVFVTNDLNELLIMSKELGIDYMSVELLKMLRDLIIPYTENNSLPEHVNQNLYNYLNICRFECGSEARKECFELCNEILGYINLSKGKKTYPLYQSMINSYYSSFLERIKYHYLFAIDPDFVTTTLSYAVELEYLTLFFHSNVIDEEEFEEDISEDLILNLVYLLVNAHLLREDPTLLKDKLYLARLSYVLKNNELLLQEYKGNPNDECLFELESDDEEQLNNKAFWKLQKKIKNKVLKAQKDS